MWPFRQKRRPEAQPAEAPPQRPAEPADSPHAEHGATRTADDVLRQLEAESTDRPAPRAERPSKRGKATAAPADPTLGRFLLAEGPLTREFVHKQLAIGGKRDSYIGKLLDTIDAPREAELIELLAAGYTVPEIDLKKCKVQVAAARSVPREVALKYKTAAIDRIGDLLCVVFAGEPNPKAIEAVRRATGLALKAFRCPPHHIKILLRRLYATPRVGAAPAAGPATPAIPISEQEYSDAAHGPAARAETRWESLHASRGPIRAARLARR